METNLKVSAHLQKFKEFKKLSTFLDITCESSMNFMNEIKICLCY